MTPALEKISSSKAFGGELIKYKFKSAALGGLDATFNLFLPENGANEKFPVLFYLAGLTCTEDNGAQKGNFLRPATKEGIAILFTDTSPRGAGVEGEDDDWDFGSGAGFYLDATNPKYALHYNMRTHIQLEIPQVLEIADLPLDLTRVSIFGHSMGGHGALCTYLTSKVKQYRSASAFAPISNPINAPWGRKAFAGYLQGGIDEAKEQYDATELIAKHSGPVHILIDYGTSDNFHKAGQLLPENFLNAARQAEQLGYDHTYFFVSTCSDSFVP
ncbi:carbohydrate esterase family 1 protein [Multifurca ochricompacta]|uniref:S-formylglutathione hydrolase n=1 Tax=Multifurca ochricompacta TaxID=376703 RepID=A0AAD4MFA3_9AGAM|nr:carbohydrate esterase family 1 protein [Multifurca ochricompacta]